MIHIFLALYLLIIDYFYPNISEKESSRATI